MTEYLLAAEADRIQDLIFSSSSLREVVGGSQLLSRFCAEVPELLGVSKDDIITSGGGSFYIRFPDEESARTFGNQLAEAYHRATGGTLSVADPVALDLEKYGESGKNAGDALRQAKQGGGVRATAQMPYIAFCQSCGLGLAEAHEKRADADAQQFYLCPACRNKAAEREDQSRDRFLKPFYEEVVASSNVSDFNWPWTAEEVAAYDPRGYVAYIVADGDGMGAIFSNIEKPEQATELSQAMDRVAREALAAPVRKLWDYLNTHKLHRDRKFIPALPLIMGGDDLFALVPAPWALDITKRLCHAFQEKMQTHREERRHRPRHHDDRLGRLLQGQLPLLPGPRTRRGALERRQARRQGPGQATRCGREAARLRRDLRGGAGQPDRAGVAQRRHPPHAVPLLARGRRFPRVGATHQPPFLLARATHAGAGAATVAAPRALRYGIRASLRHGRRSGPLERGAGAHLAARGAG